MSRKSAPFRFVRCSAVAALLGSVFAFAPVRAETDHDWKHRSSRRFTVTYDKNTEHLADQTLGIAESTATRLGSLFGWSDADRISIVLLDDADESNGESYGRTPLVRIHCRKVPMEWRDETRWLETAISHELSHSYSLSRIQRPISTSFTWSIHSDAGLQDIQVASEDPVDWIPVWFVEGMAQLGSQVFRADRRDPLREILLGQAWREGLLLDWDEMSRFQGTSREYELAYNQGYDFLLFLREAYPKLDFPALCRNLRWEPFSRVMKEAFGKPLPALHADWVGTLEKRFSSSRPDSVGARPFPRRRVPLEFEAGAAGSYAVANWRHDMLRLDLFESDGSGSWSRIFRDVGSKVVADPKTGSVWFTASMRDVSAGADQYDLFRRGKDGGVQRQTRGARCMAFDVLDDQLVYARYQAGVTELVRRSVSSGAEVVVHRFPYDTSVREISIRSADSVYMVVGAGGTTRAALSTGSGMEILWPDRAPVWSLAHWRADTTVFVAVDSAAPRLFWSVGGGAWRRIGGNALREVWRDRSVGGDRLLVGEYERGARVVRVVDPAWRTRDSAVVAKSILPDSSASRFPAREWNVASVGERAGPVIRMPLRLDMGYGWSRTSDTSGSKGTSSWYLQASEQFVHPSLDRGFGAALGGAFAPAGKRLPFFLPQVTGWLFYSAGDRDFGLSYGFSRSGEEMEENGFYEVDLYDEHSLEASVDLALDRNWELRVSGSKRWIGLSYEYGDVQGVYETQEDDLGIIAEFSIGSAALRWGVADSRMDPAELGAPGVSVWLEGQGVSGTMKRKMGWIDAAGVGGSAGSGSRWWLPGDKASISAMVDAYGSLGGVDSATVFPGGSVSMGGAGPFSAYADDELNLRAWGRGVVELRASPFASRRGKVAWSDRTRVSSRIEAGWIQYLSKDEGFDSYGNWASGWMEKTGVAASWELGLGQGLVLPGRVDASWLELSYARPLVRHAFGRRNDPYRVSFRALLL